MNIGSELKINSIFPISGRRAAINLESNSYYYF